MSDETAGDFGKVGLRAEIERLKAQNNLLRDENDKLRLTLQWIDKRGGLGLDVHDRIRAALTRIN